MAKKDFSKKELIELLQKHEVDGRVTFSSLGEIVFDSRFPDELFQNAKGEIVKARDDEKRYKELAQSLQEKYQQLIEKQNKISKLSRNKTENLHKIAELKNKQSQIEIEIEPLETEFNRVKERIEERKGE